MYKAIPVKTKRLIRQLVEEGVSYREIRDALRVSTGTISNVVHDFDHDDSDQDFREMARAIKKVLASKYLVLADAVLESVTRDEVEESSLKDMAITAAILTDKAAMLDPSVLRPDAPGEGPEAAPDEADEEQEADVNSSNAPEPAGTKG
jgi:hypothetical protein